MAAEEKVPRPRRKVAPPDAEKPYVELDDGVRVHPDLVALLRPVSEIRPDPNNAFSHGDRSVSTIAKSFSKYGQQAPILVRPDGTCIAGSGRALAVTQKLGWPRVAVLVWRGSEESARAFGVMDNRSHELGAWNWKQLAVELEAIKGNSSFDIEDVGFSDEEAGTILASLSFKEFSDADLEDQGKPPGQGAKKILVGVENPKQVEEIKKIIADALAEYTGVWVK